MQEEYSEELKRNQRMRKIPPSRIQRKSINRDVALLEREGPRDSWKMGRIEKLIKRKCGICQYVILKMLNGIRLIHAIGHNSSSPPQ